MIWFIDDIFKIDIYLDLALPLSLVPMFYYIILRVKTEKRGSEKRERKGLIVDPSFHQLSF